MIIAHITGGLGNQLFQYAMARRLAEKHNTELLVDTSSFGSDGQVRPKNLRDFKRPLKLFSFQVKAGVALTNEIAQFRDDYYRATARDRAVRQVRRVWPDFLRNKSHIQERQYRFQPEALSWPDNVYLQGFWQSPRYFEEIAPLIRQEFKPTDASIVESAREAVGKLKIQYSTVVSLHVRRGDLAYAHEILGEKNITYGAPVQMDYINQAMAAFDPATCFYVFSDTPKDIAWCRDNIRAKNIHFSKAESDIWDFSAMTLCDHHIIANSTFSWWAAWLDGRPGRRVLAPKVWSTPGVSFPMVIDDLLPSHWEII